LAIAVTVLLGVGLAVEYRQSRERALSEARQSLVSRAFEPKRRELEQFFTLTYQSIRTIGLLPSVRGIVGANRSSPDEDVVAQKRFTVEGHQTVQQLYNNLASNAAVSEVYAVLDGFDPRSQVPFFMYDEVDVGTGGGVAKQNATPGEDEPEELEAEEYAFYVQQLAQFKAAMPRFTAASLDDIPASASGLLRTCDNAQYTSKRQGDPREASGFVYSSPFYATDGAFRGLVSAVVRADVLEAALVGVPHLIITARDRADAAAKHFAPSARPADFVLANPQRNLWIGDRRDAALMERARAMLAGKVDEGLLARPLAVKDSAPWTLVYRYDPAVLTEVEQRERVRLEVELVALLVLALSVVLGPIGIWLKRTRVLEVEGRIAEIAAGGGDLTRRLDIRRTDEVGKLGRSFDGLLDRIHDLMFSIRQSAQGVGTGAEELTRANESVSNTLQEQAASSQELASSIHTLTDGAKATAAQARDASAAALGASQQAVESSQLAGRSQDAMASVLESSARITSIVELVQEIAFQTNLLALNAGVEAARAGEHGRGFAVVADEVRSLADRTSKATREIKTLAAQSVERASGMQAIIGQTTQTMESVASSVRSLSSTIDQLAASSEQQANELTRLTNAVGSIDLSVQTNSASAEESAAVAEALRAQSTQLNALVAQFKLRQR
jgi:methyl-accepting chemotaxis protein